ncbi:MAG: TetR family transcriptional regulator [Candidatus Lindowbacteria bacterium]|nr:TetR family transcriptional regulator [Candidatus Lindowbacteria bacterium]
MEKEIENQQSERRELGVRAQRKEENRHRLIQTALEILIEEGLSELTTVNVSARIGLAQPTFYAYFENIEHLLTTAITERGKAIRAAMRKALSRVTPDAVVHGDLLQARALAYCEGLNILLSDPLGTELILRYRRDPTTLVGREVGAVWAEARADFALALQKFARKLGAPAKVLKQIPFFAEIMMAETFAVAEALLDGRVTDLDEAARGLAVMNANWLSFLFVDTSFQAHAESSRNSKKTGG